MLRIGLLQSVGEGLVTERRDLRIVGFDTDLAALAEGALIARVAILLRVGGWHFGRIVSEAHLRLSARRGR